MNALTKPLVRSATCKRVLTYSATGQHGWRWDCQNPLDEGFTWLNHDHSVNFVLGIDKALPHSGDWREEMVSNCEFGCKVYFNTWTGEYALAHASSYGCQSTESWVNEGNYVTLPAKLDWNDYPDQNKARGVN